MSVLKIGDVVRIINVNAELYDDSGCGINDDMELMLHRTFTIGHIDETRGWILAAERMKYSSDMPERWTWPLEALELVKGQMSLF